MKHMCMLILRYICFKCIIISILAGSDIATSTYESANADLKGLNSHFEEVKQKQNPAYEMIMDPTAMNEPRYEKCGRGVTNSGDTAMEDNLANQSVDAACTAKAGEPTYP